MLLPKQWILGDRQKQRERMFWRRKKQWKLQQHVILVFFSEEQVDNLRNVAFPKEKNEMHFLMKKISSFSRFFVTYMYRHCFREFKTISMHCIIKLCRWQVQAAWLFSVLGRKYRSHAAGQEYTGHCSIDKLPNHKDYPRSNRVLEIRARRHFQCCVFLCIMVTCTLACGKVTCI